MRSRPLSTSSLGLRGHHELGGMAEHRLHLRLSGHERSVLVYRNRLCRTPRKRNPQPKPKRTSSDHVANLAGSPHLVALCRSMYGFDLACIRRARRRNRVSITHNLLPGHGKQGGSHSPVRNVHSLLLRLYGRLYNHLVKNFVGC